MDETLNEINETIETTETPVDDQPETIEPAEDIPEIDIEIPQEEEEIITPVDWSAYDDYEFAEGETFTDEYPPQAAVWCNESGTHHIEEIEADDGGARRFQIVKNPEPTAEEIAARKAQLKLTAADVERAIYKAKGMDFDDLIALVEQHNSSSAEQLNEDEINPSTLQQDTPSTAIDIKALKIELKANNFYRGNPYIDAIGTILGFTSEQLDNFFETGDYMELLNG